MEARYRGAVLGCNCRSITRWNLSCFCRTSTYSWRRRLCTLKLLLRSDSLVLNRLDPGYLERPLVLDPLLFKLARPLHHFGLVARLALLAEKPVSHCFLGVFDSDAVAILRLVIEPTDLVGLAAGLGRPGRVHAGRDRHRHDKGGPSRPYARFCDHVPLSFRIRSQDKGLHRAAFPLTGDGKVRTMDCPELTEILGRSGGRTTTCCFDPPDTATSIFPLVARLRVRNLARRRGRSGRGQPAFDGADRQRDDDDRARRSGHQPRRRFPEPR